VECKAWVNVSCFRDIDAFAADYTFTRLVDEAAIVFFARMSGAWAAVGGVACEVDGIFFGVDFKAASVFFNATALEAIGLGIIDIDLFYCAYVFAEH
jgi:hypothetical protein